MPWRFRRAHRYFTLSQTVDKSPALVAYEGMRRVGTLLDDFNKEVAKSFRIHQNWAEIAGEVLAAHTEPVHLKNYTLTILCDAPLWAQQVGILSDSLCEQIRKVTGLKVKTCEGRFGQPRKHSPAARPKAPSVKPAIDPQIVARIRDPELKGYILRLLAIEDEVPNE